MSLVAEEGRVTGGQWNALYVDQEQKRMKDIALRDTSEENESCRVGAQILDLGCQHFPRNSVQGSDESVNVSLSVDVMACMIARAKVRAVPLQAG